MRQLPFNIRSRAELIDALSVAASVEHIVLVQYLYAAFSCRGTSDPSLPTKVQLASLQMAQDLYDISHQEMEHLAAVQTLLGALGAPPVPDTWPFPVAEPVEAQLSRLDRAAIDRFVRLEAPPPSLEAAIVPPDPVQFEFLGDLYRAIAEGIRLLGDDAFVGAPVMRDTPVLLQFGGRARPVDSAEEALATLQKVIEEGEGATADAPTGHHARFLAMRARHEQLGAEAELLSWPCAPNPSVQPGQAGTTLLTHPFTLQLGDVANRVYRALWHLLGATYAYDWARGDPEPVQRSRRNLGLRCALGARHLMATGIRPLGELLARVPAFADGGDLTGGFPFEQYQPFRLPSQPEARILNIAEELEFIARDLADLSKADDLPDAFTVQRLEAVASDVTAIRRRLTGDWPPSGPRPRFEPASNQGRFLAVDFQGYYQVRLATGGDPYADPRGVSGWIFALPGEPDLDRVIRLQSQGTALRAHIDPHIEIGTFVTGADTTSPLAEGLPAGLAGAAVNFLDSPMFEGHNGLIAGDTDEPIVPLRISVRGEGWRLERSAEDAYSSPFTNQASLGQVRSPDAAELRTALGVPVVTDDDFATYVDAATARLRAAQAAALSQGDEDEASVLEFRIGRIGSPPWTFTATVGWRFELTGNDAVVEQPGSLPVSTMAPWWLELLSTGYDPDAQTAVLRGVLHVPLTDSREFPAWRLRFPSSPGGAMPLDGLGFRPGR